MILFLSNTLFSNTAHLLLAKFTYLLQSTYIVSCVHSKNGDELSILICLIYFLVSFSVSGSLEIRLPRRRSTFTTNSNPGQITIITIVVIITIVLYL